MLYVFLVGCEGGVVFFVCLFFFFLVVVVVVVTPGYLKSSWLSCFILQFSLSGIMSSTQDLGWSMGR